MHVGRGKDGKLSGHFSQSFAGDQSFFFLCPDFPPSLGCLINPWDDLYGVGRNSVFPVH